MDLSFAPEDEEFRREIRAFIEREYDEDLRRQMAQSKNGYLDKEGQMKWMKKLANQGWLAPNWPKEYGGPGWSPTQKYIFDVETSAAGTPLVLSFGVKMVAPVIMAFGSDEQKQKYLPPILAGDVWWCQGYSEPGSGSDLASLQMKAEDKGDHYLCNGSKIWTSYAQNADWIFCLVRTDPNADKPQQGISFILIDMKTPGISVEPIVTLDMPIANQQEVNQVFFDDVRVPKENLIGEVNRGWTYAKYLLEFERGNAYGPGLKRSLAKVRSIAENELVGTGERLIDDDAFGAKICDVERQITAMEFTELRIFAALSSGERPGPESSLLKAKGSEIGQSITELALEATGFYTQPLMRDTWAEIKGRTNEPRVGPTYAAPVGPHYFNYRKASIYGGSNEVQRNIMAKLVLGL